MDRVICQQFNLSWLELQKLTYEQRTILTAVALDADELEDYHWWVNSQQDPKKFKWSSPDKAGTDPILPMTVIAKRLSRVFGGGNIEKAKEVAKHLGRPLIYIIAPDTYLDEDFNPITMTEELMNIAVVVRKPNA